MASVPPPGRDTRGDYWRLEPSPQAAAPGARRGASLLLLALALVAGGFALLSAIGGGTARSVSPIAEAADRTAQVPGVRVSFTGTASASGLVKPMRMRGHGLYNGRTDRASAVAQVRGYGLHARAWAKGEGNTEYVRSACIAASLPRGKSWAEVRPYRSNARSQVLSQGSPTQWLRLLNSVSAHTTNLGQYIVNHTWTTRYSATLDPGKVARYLHRQGFVGAIPKIRRAARRAGETVSVWVDSDGLLRRETIDYQLPVRGRDPIAMHIDGSFSDYGIAPHIGLPPRDEVFDATRIERRAFKAHPRPRHPGARGGSGDANPT